MKKIFLLIFLAIGISGCSVESLDSTEVLTTADAKFTTQSPKNPMGIYSGPNLKGTVSITHDCDNLYVKLTPTGDAPTTVKLGIFKETNLPNENGYAGEMHYGLEDGKDLLWTFNIAENGYNTASNLNIFFTAWGGSWIGTNTLGNKPHAPNYSVFNFDFSNLDCGGCDESFSYSTNNENTYTFNYTPETNMENAALVFTFAQSVAVSGLSTWTNNGSTMQKTMDLNACQQYSWTITLLKDCAGNSPNSNVWTDFTVNKVSKKGDMKNITQICS